MKREIQVIKGREKEVDRLFTLHGKIKNLAGEVEVLERGLKEAGEKAIIGFGSVEFAGKGDVRAQIQVRRGTVVIPTCHFDEVEESLGDSLPLLFDVKMGGEVVRVDRLDELKRFILKHGGKVERFIEHQRTASAKDTWLDEAVRMRILGKRAKKIIECIGDLLSVRAGCTALKPVVK